MTENRNQKPAYIKRPVFSFCVGGIFMLFLLTAHLWSLGFSFRPKHAPTQPVSIAAVTKPLPETAPVQQAFSKTCYLENPTPECLNSIEPVSGE